MFSWTMAALAAEVVEVRVVLREHGSGVPVQNADVTVEGQVLHPDADGVIRFAHAPGPVSVTVTPLDHAAVTVELTVPADEEIWLRRLSWTEELTVWGHDDGDAVQRQTVSIEELRRVPGSFGDPVRALQSLPAVARPRSVEGALVVRGAESITTGTYIDGVQVPFLFHLLVGKSVVSPSLIHEVEFYPGGMPLRYGDVAQAVVDARTDDGPVLRGGLHGDVHVDLMEVGGAVRVPLPADFDLRLSGRASWLSAIVRAGQLGYYAVSGLSEATSRPGGLRVPYSDHYVRLQHPAGHDGRVFVTLFGADDAIRLIPERHDLDGQPGWDPLEEVPPGDVDRTNLLQNHFVRGVVGWDGTGEVLSHQTRLSVGRDHQRNIIQGLGVFANAPQDADVRTEIAWFSHANRIALSEAFTVTTGAEARLRVSALRELGVGEEGEREGPVVQDRQLWGSPHAGLEWTVGPLWLSPGMRWSTHWLNDDLVHSAEPRAAMRLSVSDRLTARASVGRFSQAPTPDRYALSGAPSPLIRGQQATLGMALGLGAVWTLSADVFDTSFRDLVVKRDVPALGPAEWGFAQELVFEPFYDATSGAARGVEVLVRRMPAGGWFGWLALSAGRSVRTVAGETVPSDYDTPFDGTLLVARDLSKGWGISGRVQAGVGQPYTPQTAVYVSGADMFLPVSGAPNSSRYPPFFQLDLRIDKTWTARSSRWTLYLDVYNATSHPNPLLTSYNWDYSEHETRGWIPILPSLGAEVSF